LARLLTEGWPTLLGFVDKLVFALEKEAWADRTVTDGLNAPGIMLIEAHISRSLCFG
jgi:hypothetical protein